MASILNLSAIEEIEEENDTPIEDIEAADEHEGSLTHKIK